MESLNLTQIAESVNWQVSYSEQNQGKEIAFEFETWTDTAGQNVLVSVVVNNTDDEQELLEELADKLNECYENFDPKEEAALYWENRHKLRGTPQSLHILLKDMEEAESLIEKLAETFHRAC